MKKIIFFYGKECPHCHKMQPLVDKLKEEGIEVEKLEVWRDEKNAKKMRKFTEKIKKACGGEFGVPAYVDEENNRANCGEMPYEELKKWATK